MADTTTNAAPDTRAGQKGSDTTIGKQDNLAPADQTGFDPKDAKWDDIPGAAARANGWPQAT